jgi:LysR family transcriptional activator of nhaA
MSSLNFKHLRYFWMVAKTGSIARAAEQLHLTPQSISGQLTEFADVLGVELFRKSGRNLEITDVGRRMLSYAEDIFSTSDELLEVLRDQQVKKTLPFRVGFADSVSKTIAYRLVEPALQLEEPLRLICREGRMSSLLAELAVHKLDMIVADRPMPTHLNVRGYSHLLGESALTVFGTSELAARLTGSFPNNLNNAPFLLPGEDVPLHSKLIQWFDAQDIRPRIVGEFDDSALMCAFGQSCAGLFAAPKVIARHICEQYKVQAIGDINTVVDQVFAITTERRLRHPATVAISQVARLDIFSTSS